jgi:hypothetical protein
MSIHTFDNDTVGCDETKLFQEHLKVLWEVNATLSGMQQFDFRE